MEKHLFATMLLYLVILTLIPLSHTAIITDYKTYKDYKIYEVEGHNDDLRKMVKTLTDIAELPFYDFKDSIARLLLAPDLVDIFEQTVEHYKLKAKVVVQDYSEIIQMEKSGSRRGSGFSWTSYYDIDDIYGFLSNMSKAYSNWTQLVVGGESYEGRQILGLRINTPTQNTEPKNIVFIESGIHAREWITPATTTYFINQLLTSDDPKITSLRDQFEWQIFPSVNPDGYHYSFTRDRMWRKTRSKSTLFCYGADPNRNWDFNWLEHGASNNPCNYQTYAGSRPFSEKETSTLSDYIAELDNVLAYIAFHSDAQILLVPYSDSVEHISNYEDLIKIGETSLEYGRKVNGEEYGGPATAAEILYKASGGSMDWVRHNLATPLVYTYELRGTYFYWPPERIFEQGDEVTQMLLGLFTEAANLGACGCLVEKRSTCRSDDQASRGSDGGGGMRFLFQMADDRSSRGRDYRSSHGSVGMLHLLTVVGGCRPALGRMN